MNITDASSGVLAIAGEGGSSWGGGARTTTALAVLAPVLLVGVVVDTPRFLVNEAGVVGSGTSLVVEGCLETW